MRTNPTIIRNFFAAVIGGFIAIGATLAAAQDAAAEAGMEVLTRGPVHEAFAGAVTYDPLPGLVIGKAPPEPIEEIPPDQRPEGANVMWIPGYWAWDEDRNDFLWVSGIWRNLPPGRQWMPGYWTAVDAGWQWTSGYFEDAAAAGIAYLPAPPRSVEEGPSVPATDEGDVWIPGNWVWRGESYAWSAGYWNAGREDWIWTPSCYRWSSRGYIYVNGYWDYEIPRRGVLFAPVCFDTPIYRSVGYRYCPSTVIGVSAFYDHLFFRPRYGHYYFGDYYAPSYLTRGYYASCYYGSGRLGYDPIYTHHRWRNRHDRHWERSHREQFAYRREHASARPPRNWASNDARGRGEQFAERYDRVVARQDGGPARFRTMDWAERERVMNRREEFRTSASTRLKTKERIASNPVAQPNRLRPATGRTQAAISPPRREATRQQEGIRPPARREIQPAQRSRVGAPVRNFTPQSRAQTAPSSHIQRATPQVRQQQQVQRARPQVRQSQPPQLQRSRPQQFKPSPSRPSPSSGDRSSGGRQRGNR